VSARLTFGLFGVASLIAVALGCVAAAANGVAVGLWGRNLVAWGVGALLALAVARAPVRAAPGAPLILAMVGIAASFLFPSLDGVHRWIGLGPVRLNAAELLAPMAAVALARGHTSTLTLASAAILAVLLTAQPDRSQAVALAGVMVTVALASSSAPWARRLFTAATPVVAAVAVFARPDPLQPVPEVEGIVRLAAAVSPLLAIAAVAGVIAAVAAPLAAGRKARTAALALTVHLAITSLAAFVAPFPVPLIGMGLSPILGAWLGIGLLLRPTAP